MRTRLAALTLAAALSACATTPPAPASVVNGVLVGPNQMTLYTFDKDSAGKSMCSGPCIANWPALKAADDAKASGDWSIISRDDGSRQWAYKGKPLYFWSKDAKPGDRSGDGFNKVWHSATP
ncbi:COG4315 family predicted lipoprotein [Paucibacter soli]|uniref:COG4315 family predicted lipoprotein n=1 Tax=Paucibacter soli TaxID=3133433 RepID=UPI0030A115A6